MIFLYNPYYIKIIFYIIIMNIFYLIQKLIYIFKNIFTNYEVQNNKKL